MYRPKDWKNPYKRVLLDNCIEEVVFEAGADAMLEALQKEGEANSYVPGRGRGWLVFIPDEQVKKDD